MLEDMMISTWNLQDIACPFNNGELESKTDTQEGYLLFSCPFYGQNHTLSTSPTETAWYEDTTIKIH